MIIHTPLAPKAIGPYSQAVRVGDLLFVSGCLPICPETGNILSQHIEDQTHRALLNLQAIVNAAGLNMSQVVKTTCFISDLNEFASFNESYTHFFDAHSYPARSCVEVSRLPKDARIEIEAIASFSSH